MNKLLNGQLVELTSDEETAITTEETKVKAEIAANGYKRDRAREYPDWGTQLDYIYHNGIDKWKTDIVDPIKNRYPKP